MYANNAYVLLVEDSEEDIELTLRSFRSVQIVNEVIVKRDGVEALAFLESLAGSSGQPTGEIPSLILLDVNLPGMSGIALLEKIRLLGHMRYVPVAMLTSSDEEDDLVASYEHGANSFVRKPIAPADFASLIGRLGAYWITRNEVPSRPVPKSK